MQTGILIVRKQGGWAVSLDGEVEGHDWEYLLSKPGWLSYDHFSSH